MNTIPMTTQLEGLLFVSSKPLSFKKLAAALNTDQETIQKNLTEIEQRWEAQNSGMRLQRDDEKVQIVSAPQASDVIQEFLKSENERELTRPSLETLTIIAYRSPVKRAEIENIRGINCGLILRNLLMRDLIEETPGPTEAEYVYRPSFNFLRWLGIKETRELPEYEKLNSNEHLEALLKKDSETKTQQ